jgi:superfamily II DNA or RNA helicase
LDIPITLFITGRKKLARQTRERFALRLRVNLEDIGFIQGGKWEEGTTGVFVVVIDSLISKKFTRERSALYKACELLIIDEAHHTGSSTWYRTLMFCRARYRYGLTGTPVGRSDSGDLYLRACTGDVVAEIRAAELIESGVLAKPEIHFIGIDKPDLNDSPYSWAEVYSKGIVHNAYRNGVIIDYAKQLQSAEKKTLILVREIAHGRQLALEIPNSEFLHGSLPDENIDTAVSQFETGELSTLIATSIFDEGIDIPSINALILATGGKSAISTLQRIGRGLRKKQGDNRLFVFDFEDRGNGYLKDHSQARAEVCERESFNIHFIEPTERVQSLIDR